MLCSSQIVTTNKPTHSFLQAVYPSCLICFMSTSIYSALGVSAIMRYINRRFTYLLTYLSPSQQCQSSEWKSLAQPVDCKLRSNLINRISIAPYCHNLKGDDTRVNPAPLYPRTPRLYRNRFYYFYYYYYYY